MGVASDHRVTYDHSESLRESGGVLAFGEGGGEGKANLAERGEGDAGGGLDVVYGHTAVRVTSASVSDLGSLERARALEIVSIRLRRGPAHSNEGTVGVFEVEHGRPVVRFVFFESAGGAG